MPSVDNFHRFALG